MADKTTTDLTAASAITGAELTAIVQGGNSRKTTFSDTGTYFKTLLSASAPISYNPSTGVIGLTVPGSTGQMLYNSSGSLAGAGLLTSGSTNTNTAVYWPANGGYYPYVRSNGYDLEFAITNVLGSFGSTPTLTVMPGQPAIRIYGDLWLNTDTKFVRVAANRAGLRNGANAQTFDWYGTYTDASNYRRVTVTMSTAGVGKIGPEGAGTGASGNILLLGTGGIAVASLPAASSHPYCLASVTDATSTTPRSTAAGGGSNKCVVWSDGTNWLIVV